MFKVRSVKLNIFLILLGVVLIDRLFKFIFIRTDLVSKNPGIAFGISSNTPGFTILLLVIGIILILFLARNLNFKKFSNQLGFSLILGGVLSNIIDRLAYGYIIDYINISYLSSLNFADICIVAGGVILAVYFLTRSKTTDAKN